MTIVSFIEDHRVVDRIIRHLKLTFDAERPPQPHNIQQEPLMTAEEKEEYFCGLSRLLFVDLRTESIFNLLVWRFWLNFAIC